MNLSTSTRLHILPTTQNPSKLDEFGTTVISPTIHNQVTLELVIIFSMNKVAVPGDLSWSKIVKFTLKVMLGEFWCQNQDICIWFQILSDNLEDLILLN